MQDLEAEVEQPKKQRIFLKALLWSTVIEVVVLVQWVCFFWRRSFKFH